MLGAMPRAFRIWSSVGLLALGIGTVTFLAVGAAALLAGSSSRGLGIACLVVAASLVLLFGVLRLLSFRHAAALAALRRRHPDGVVFLAKRRPPIVSDLETWLDGKGLDDVEVGDGWIPILVDERGISAWTSGPEPRQLLLMEWWELGEIGITDTADVAGHDGWGVAVDVRPYAVPLIADLGDTNGYIILPLSRGDARRVVEAVNARRPG